MEYLSPILSIAALIVSAYSLYTAVAGHRDSSKSQTIREVYSIFLELDRLQLQNWELSHLFAVAENYETICSQIRSRKDFSQAEKGEMLLKERALALLIFDIFEHSFYQWLQAKDAGDKQRKKFLEDVLLFFTNRLLRNPRLLYYWQDTEIYYEEKSRKYYADHILNNSKFPLTHLPDRGGLFEQSSVPAQ